MLQRTLNNSRRFDKIDLRGSDPLKAIFENKGVRDMAENFKEIKESTSLKEDTDDAPQIIELNKKKVKKA